MSIINSLRVYRVSFKGRRGEHSPLLGFGLPPLVNFDLKVNQFQARSQKIMVGGSFKGNVDLFLWSHSANHSPGAVDELMFSGVCKPTFIRAKYMNFKKYIVFTCPS